MFCEHCGTQVNESQRFCPNCGLPIVANNGSNAMGTPGYVSSVPSSQPKRNSSSIAIPALAVICTALVMVIIGFSFIANGTLSVGGSQTPQASSQLTSTGTVSKDDTDKKKTEEAKKKEEEEKAKEEASKEESSPVVNNNITINTEPGTTVRTYESTPAPAPEPEPEPEPTYTYSDYVLPDSTYHYYSTSELSSLSDWDLYIARNEIYARHGRGFVRDDLRDYFSHCSWYSERYDPDYFDENIASSMNDCEWHNIETILDYEHYRGSPYP